ncbi:hypothetical protein OUZ56_002831 [Daphnia magna]|uniref:Uncharacterized protein n=1 Tax=Daphnia magna TaxID=35525 RepID=A0ABR0A7C2_9CRUS|nr:hypothetical protein OUZ56_002831 [Daphnia magna]
MTTAEEESKPEGCYYRQSSRFAHLLAHKTTTEIVPLKFRYGENVQCPQNDIGKRCKCYAKSF